MSKWIYFFGGDGKTNMTEGKGEMKDLLGGKGANLAEMARLGLDVPPGFTISTDVCTYFYANNKTYPASLEKDINENMSRLEKCMGLKFGSKENPLLVSVRSGARASMPGMMDTVLNLGLNDETAEGLAKMFNNSRFALDCYRRFIQMYSDVVLNVHVSNFESLIEEQKDRSGVKIDSELKEDDLLRLIKKFKEVVLSEGHVRFPQDVNEQLNGAIGAVFGSWMTPRAVHYRKMESIPESWGTAVNVQSMVYGNMNNDCATGVLFTRNPATGKAGVFGEYLENAQGEDVVAGIRNPHPISKKQKQESGGEASLEESMPEVYKQISDICKKLEGHYKDMQDIEFTIQNRRLFMLQTRRGKRTAQAAVKIAIDMVKEGLIDKNEGIMRVDPYSIDQLLHPRLDPSKKGKPIAKGLPASPGAVCGEVVFQSNDAEKKKAQGKRVILVRHETSPEDIHGMDAAVGILTALGGMTSHAAVVARGMGKSCIAGCADLHIDYKQKQFVINKGENVVIKEGDIITLDANTGEIFAGEIPTLSSTLDDDFGQLMQWSDSVRRMKIRTNADTPHDARTARAFGAEGIGLCRTEHMFFDPERIDAVRAMILSDSPDERARALESIFPFQKNDFVKIFVEMKGLPVTIRLLDPPLHEFLPHAPKDIENLAAKLGTSVDRLMKKAETLHEINPMLGHRGCRLGISFPEIYLMQARAIGEAIVEAAAITKESVEAEIMIPLTMEKKELAILSDKIQAEVKGILSKAKLDQKFKCGTMIEIPRAALLSDQIAEVADFFSFGTNDLTQMTLGLSRDDSGRFLPEYIDRGIFARDPFASIDVEGVGQLVRMSVEKSRKVKPNFKTGVCGEHGGDPRSIFFFEEAGLDYVSCSPYRVPAARLAAAQAKLMKKS
jgi:pyruvate,orthophosphate dikinase